MMASKKRCDFCLKIKTDNLHEYDKILDKDLRTLLVNGTGIDATPAQLSTFLACCDCAIGIAQASPIMQKARILLTKFTTRKIIRKRKNDDSSAGNNTLENGGVGGGIAGGDNSDDVVEHEGGNNSTPAQITPKPIVQRRKSITNSKKILNTPLGDDLMMNNSTPVASSTLAIINEPKTAIKSITKKTPIKKTTIENNKSEADNKEETTFNIKLPKKVQQRRKSIVEKDVGDGDGDAKPVKKQAKKVLNGKQDSNAIKTVESGNSSSSASSLKGVVAASPVKTLKASPIKTLKASPAKPFNKVQLDSPSIKTAAAASPFKTPPAVASPHKRKLFAKFSDDETQPTPPPSSTQQTLSKKQRTESENYSSSQEDSNKPSKVCNNCGKIFRHDERYLAHVESMKCSSAKYECKDLNCSRRFHNLEKMHEHIQRKHPGLMRANDSDDDED